MAHRDMQSFYYCQFLDSSENSAVAEEYIVDEYGNMTSELLTRYSAAVEMRANISPATGNSQMDTFGQLDNYDKVIVTSWMDCPITEKSVLFIDQEPEYDEITVTVVSEVEEEPETVTVQIPKYNYIVRRVAKSLHFIAYAVQKVR